MRRNVEADGQAALTICFKRSADLDLTGRPTVELYIGHFVAKALRQKTQSAIDIRPKEV